LMRSGTFRAFINVPGVAYFVITMGIYSYLYWIILFKKKKSWFIITTIIFLIFSSVNLFLTQGISINSYAYICHAGILILFSLSYFFLLMRDLPTLYVHHLPMFWFNSAFLIYSAGTFFLFSFTAYLINVLRNNMLVYWSFHHILSIIEHLIILIGLYYDLRQTKTWHRNSAVPPQF